MPGPQIFHRKDLDILVCGQLQHLPLIARHKGMGGLHFQHRAFKIFEFPAHFGELTQFHTHCIDLRGRPIPWSRVTRNHATGHHQA